MSKTKVTNSYPHARLKAMEEIMEFARNPKWHPTFINTQLVKMLNIAPSKEGLVINTLKFLGLINANNEPTENFCKLKKEYKETIKSIVEEKYSDVFTMIPEELIDQPRIVNFFMSKAGTARDTAEYQGMLFGWLCRQGGILVPKLSDSFKRDRFEKARNNS
jgi:hypothetical protein